MDRDPQQTLIKILEISLDLAKILPFLDHAVLADQGSSMEGRISRSVQVQARSLVNEDVLEAQALVLSEIPDIDATARKSLGERPKAKSIPGYLRNMAGLMAKVLARGGQSDLEFYSARLHRVHRQVRLALGLSTPDQPLGLDCPHCGGSLVIPGRDALIDTDPLEIRWIHTPGIKCRGECGNFWTSAQARWLRSQIW